MKMNIMTREDGHKVIDVNTADTVSIADAMARFDELTGEKKHTAVAKMKDGTTQMLRKGLTPEQMPSIEEITFVTPLQGG